MTAIHTIHTIHNIHTVDGERDAANADDIHYALLASRFNAEVVDNLVAGAVESLAGNGVADSNITLVHVPGALELPLAAKKLADSGDYSAVIALGAVIRGETPHFDYVAGECARGLTEVSLANEVPVLFGVVTADSMEQAMARATPRPTASDNSDKKDKGADDGGINKGVEAALAALDMVSLLLAKLPQEKGLRDQQRKTRMLRSKGNKRY